MSRDHGHGADVPDERKQAFGERYQPRYSGVATFMRRPLREQPAQWDGIEIGIVGTKGVIDVEDTHRDLVLATEEPLPAGYTTREFEPPMERHVDFLTSYPPGDIWNKQFWGPMREETMSWFSRIMMGVETPHASAADGHRNLMLTMAMDRSARLGTEVVLPVEPDVFYDD